jgi:hypothetical protein
MLSRAERLIGAGLKDRRRRFDARASVAISDLARQGALDGSVHRERMHALCAAELHARATAITRRLLKSHKAINAPATDEYRQEAKDWIAALTVEEGTDLRRHLWKPRSASGERGLPDNLNAELQHEVDGAHATIDNAFDRLQCDRVERILRWAKRKIPGVGKMVRVTLSR